MLVSRLDAVTSDAWEMHRSADSLPTLRELLSFLERRARALANAISMGRGVASNGRDTERAPGPSRNGRSNSRSNRSSSRRGESSNGAKCHLCKGGHPLYRCPDFLALTTQGRVDRARAWGLCLNCLRTGHQAQACGSGPCRRCHGSKKHNSVLCLSPREIRPVVASAIVVPERPQEDAAAAGAPEPQ